MSFIFFSSLLINPALGNEAKMNMNLDSKERRLIVMYKGRWVDWNIPEVDGKVLFELIRQNNLKKAVDIGTPTGHSAIWVAWALSKTGKKLITIETHEGSYKAALANYREAGLSEYIDARLADAHEPVKELEGPFDFVFCDADKGGKP